MTARSTALLWGAMVLVSGGCLSGCREKATPPIIASTASSPERDHPSARDAQAGKLAPTASGKPVSSEPSALEVEPPRAPADKSWPKLQAPAIARDFCTERVHTLDSDACFALPEARAQTLLIYLHGIVPPARDSVQKTNFEKVVANASERAGVVALIPRGKQGFAPKAYPGWWGWPTSKAAFSRHGAEFIEKLRDKRQKLEALLEVEFERSYLAGSSSGAYFVAAVALHGAMPEIDGYGIISGGSGYTTSQFDALPRKPVYVGFGKHDSVGPSAKALARLLEQAGWPVKLGAHSTGHGAREIYLDEAFEFWRQH